MEEELFVLLLGIVMVLVNVGDVLQNFRCRRANANVDFLSHCSHCVLLVKGYQSRESMVSTGIRVELLLCDMNKVDWHYFVLQETANFVSISRQLLTPSKTQGDVIEREVLGHERAILKVCENKVPFSKFEIFSVLLSTMLNPVVNLLQTVLAWLKVDVIAMVLV